MRKARAQERSKRAETLVCKQVVKMLKPPVFARFFLPLLQASFRTDFKSQITRFLRKNHEKYIDILRTFWFNSV